jgi:hypothetical protein
MSDRSSPPIFHMIFSLLSRLKASQEELDIDAEALEFWNLAQEYDFWWGDLEVDTELKALGLCHMEIDPRYPEKKPHVVYGPRPKENI